MKSSLLENVQVYVEENIGNFHEKRLISVTNQKLNKILKRKNPYLFKAKSQNASELVKSILDAYLSSQEETLFGDFLEGVAIFVAQYIYDGYKPTSDELTGIDLVFVRDTNCYIVEIKSGPNWGNSSQVTKMYLNFREAINRLKPQYPDYQIIPVNGCMYGKDHKPEKVGKIKNSGKIVDIIPYWKLCGQDFWYFISGSKNLYIDIIEPLGYRAKQRNEEFLNEYDKLLNRFTRDFMNDYCDAEGAIMWDYLTRFVSESKDNDIISNVEI